MDFSGSGWIFNSPVRIHIITLQVQAYQVLGVLETGDYALLGVWHYALCYSGLRSTGVLQVCTTGRHADP